MANYLQWRGAAWHFRIGVPLHLRPMIGKREITASLGTVTRPLARAMSLALAGRVLAFYSRVEVMSEQDKQKAAVVDLVAMVKLGKAELWNQLAVMQIDASIKEIEAGRDASDKEAELEQSKAESAISAEAGEGLRQRLAEAAQGKELVLSNAKRVIADQHGKRKQAEKDAEESASMNKALQRALAAACPPPPPPHLQLSVLVAEWLEERGEGAQSKAIGPGKERKGSARYEDDKRIMGMFLASVGDISATALKSKDILNYLALVAKMPNTRGHPKPFEGCRSVQDYIERNKKLATPRPLIAFSSMEITHIQRLRIFFTWCVTAYADQGVPAEILAAAVKGYKYTGSNKGGDKGNRPFSSDELRKLFEGEYMAELASDPAGHERYWLLHLGLFTGMRVGETLLINPQADIVEQDGVMLIQLTEITEKAKNVHNSIKKNDEEGRKEREIPIHSKLIELGFLDYAKRCAKAGHKTLFPTMAETDVPENRASKDATDCFLRAGVHDPETKGKQGERGILTGFHAFRGTMSRAALAVGTARCPAHFYVAGRPDPGADKTEQKHYANRPPTVQLKEYIEAISYPVNFTKPTV